MKKIKDLCNNLLIASKDRDINFIDWLHYVKNHEYLIKKYKPNQFKLLEIGKNIIIYLIINIRNLFKNSTRFSISKSDLDFLIISHKLNNKKNNDIYFGDIKSFFKKNKINFKIFFFSHIKTKNKENIINHASLIEKLEILIYVILKFIKIIVFSKSIIGDYKFNFRLKVASELLSPKTFENFIIYKNLIKIDKSKKVKNLIVPFEGFSYERVIFYSFNKLKLKTNLLGYQHASIIKSQNGIFRKLNKEYNPNIILTSGLETKKILKEYYPTIKIFVLGSNKISHSTVYKNINKRNIIVLPEGIETECFYMMKYISNIEFNDENINFIFRLHPSLSFKYLQKKYPIFNIKRKNIIFSSRSLSDDIKNSKYCLYRGSTSVINCILNNLHPIYLNKKNYNEINILSDHKSVSKVNNPQDLIKVVNVKKNIFINKNLVRFGKKYFTKINYEILKSFI